MSGAFVSRHHPLLVGLHWVLALTIIGLLGLGFFVLADMPNTDPRKLAILVWHMAGGILVLALMILRVIIRVRSARPKAASTRSPGLDRLASMAHRGLYGIVFAMIASGWGTGFLIRGAFQPHGGHLPETFAAYPTFRIHAALAVLLAILIVGHVAAALYHQFALKDGLFGRMWFGRREQFATRERTGRIRRVSG